MVDIPEDYTWPDMVSGKGGKQRFHNGETRDLYLRGIFKYINEGMSWSTVSDRMKISKWMLRNVLNGNRYSEDVKRLGLKREAVKRNKNSTHPLKNRNTRDQYLILLFEKYNAGEKVSDISEDLNISVRIIEAVIGRYSYAKDTMRLRLQVNRRTSALKESFNNLHTYDKVSPRLIRDIAIAVNSGATLDECLAEVLPASKANDNTERLILAYARSVKALHKELRRIADEVIGET